MRKYLIILILILPIVAKGQYNLTLFQLHETVPQANQLNPGLLPNGQVIIGFPLISNFHFGVSNSFSAQEVFTLNESNYLVPNLSAFQSNLARQNTLQLSGQWDPLYIGFWAKKNFISLHVGLKQDFTVGYPGSLIDFFIEGNGGENLGARIEFDDLIFKTSGYVEYALGFGRSALDDRLNWGIRFKYLQGIYHASLEKGFTGSIYTDPETYAITLKADNMIFNSAGSTSMEINSFWDLGNIYEDPLNDYIKNNNNHGYAFDAGASLKLTSKLKIYASVIDLGYINWNKNVKNFSLHDAEYTFEGVDLRNSEDFSQAVLDSLEAVFDPIETETAFTEGLSSKFYAGGEYKLGKHHTAGILTYGRFVQGKLNPAVSLNYNVKFGRTLNTAITYSIMNNSYDNIGVGFSLNLGFLQVYGVTDNVLAYVKPQAVQNADIRLGLNMTFGRKRHERILNGLPGNRRKAADQLNEQN